MQTILIVDDVAMFRELESLFLARCGRLVTEASGAAALARIRDDLPDLVVLDMNLPDLSGEEVCRTVKSDPALVTIPVIVVTRDGSAEDHARAVRAGADDVIAKPISRLTLVQTVNRFLRFREPRGLPRVNLRSPVRMVRERGETWGVSRNLSRGGMFIESYRVAPRDSELHLEFRLPESSRPVSPAARVVWCRASLHGAPEGMGVRFVGLDAHAASQIEAYVHECGLPAGTAETASLEAT